MHATASHSPAIGQPRSYPAGKFTVHIRPMPQGNTRVETTYAMSSQIVDGLDRSFPSPNLAQSVKNVLVNALTQVSDLPVSGQQAIDYARAAVARFIDDQIKWLSGDDSINATDAVAYLQDLRAGYSSAAEDEWADKLIAQIRADFATRARTAGVL